MRPRHRAAEYRIGTREGDPRGEEASMRPRHRAAEYGLGSGTRCPSLCCFNEAAA